MKLTPLSLYKLVEMDRALAVIDQHDSLAPGQGKEIAIGGRDDLVILLHRYMSARERGLDFEAARYAALDGAEVVAHMAAGEIVRLPGSAMRRPYDTGKG